MRTENVGVSNDCLFNQWAQQADVERISAVAALLIPLSLASDGDDPWAWVQRLHEAASVQKSSDEACSAFCQRWLFTSEPTLADLYAFVYGVAKATW